MAVYSITFLETCIIIIIGASFDVHTTWMLNKWAKNWLDIDYMPFSLFSNLKKLIMRSYPPYFSWIVWALLQ